MFEQHFVNAGHGGFGYVAYHGVIMLSIAGGCISSGSWEFYFFYFFSS